jgi:hypothetical protein
VIVISRNNNKDDVDEVRRNTQFSPIMQPSQNRPSILASPTKPEEHMIDVLSFHSTVHRRVAVVSRYCNISIAVRWHACTGRTCHTRGTTPELDQRIFLTVSSQQIKVPKQVTTSYWLLLPGGFVQSVPCTATILWSVVRPHLSYNHTWFIYQIYLLWL